MATDDVTTLTGRRDRALGASAPLFYRQLLWEVLELDQPLRFAHPRGSSVESLSVSAGAAEKSKNPHPDRPGRSLTWAARALRTRPA